MAPTGARALRRSAGYLMAFLRPEPAVKRGTFDAAICIDSPVRGLRPSRAPRAATWNLPKPVNVTSPPLLSVDSMVPSTASTAAAASFLERPASWATLSTNSDFDIGSSSFVPLQVEATLTTPADGQIGPFGQKPAKS